MQNTSLLIACKFIFEAKINNKEWNNYTAVFYSAALNATQ